MAEKTNIRKQIGLIFSNNENWIGGTYYITNLIHALNTLSEKPHIQVYTSTNDIKAIEIINYPYISYHKIIDGYYDYPKWQSIINKVAKRLFKREIFDERPTKMDICFPNPPKYCFAKILEKYKVNWIPDFQEDYLPHFFSEKEVQDRKKYQLALSQQENPIIFSSFDALNDFKRLYPQHKNKTFVLQFAVTHPEYNTLKINELLEKYKLPEKYFFAPNQFWKHKNHIIVLEAIKILKEKGKDILVAFSGKEEDYRNPQYFKDLQKYVLENNLTDSVRFLGFIDRKEQLQLMKNAICIIQPSLFEGWSTVVEDAKAMNTHLICSDLKVHREQTNINITFFDAYKVEELAEKIQKIKDNQPEIQISDYQNNIKKLSRHFRRQTNGRIIQK